MTITGINNHGDLTGHVEVVVDDPQCGCRDIVHFAFARIAGQDHVLVPPEWARAVFPDAINDNGVIVGSAELHNHSETGEMVGFRADLTAGAWAMIRHPNLQDGWSLWLTDIDNKGRMTAIVGRHVDSYYESWWLRPR